MTVKENLAFFTGINGFSPSKSKDRMEYLLHQFQLQDQRDTVVNKLSRGMKQKVAIAISLVTDKDIILLDEPTLGLDVGMSHELRGLLKTIAKEEGKTILLSTHDMQVVEETCDRLVIINQGKTIVHDTVENLMRLTNQHFYLLQLKEQLNHDLQQRIANIAKGIDLRSDTNGYTYLITLENPNGLYEIMEILKNSGAELLFIERTNNRLEDIFINLVKEAGNHEISP